MLSLLDPRGRYGRRAFLKVGGLTLGGLSLADLLSLKALAAASDRPVRDKSVVFLFMHGGPSQFETFDPKPDAPAEIRCQTGEAQTKIPGVTIGSQLPRLAALADRVAFVRSFATGDANHDIKPIVSRHSAGANLGSVYSRVAGINHPVTGIPSNMVLFPQAVDSTTMPGIMNFGRFDSSGALGAAYAPFVPSEGGNLQQDMKLSIAMDRLDHRRSLLRELDRVRFGFESGSLTSGMDQMREQAFTTILGGVADAFDLSQEDPAVVERYDTAPLVRPEAISKRWNNYSRYVDNAKALGKLMLLARRLCERGAGFVTVTTNFVWDMHADANNAGVIEGMRYMGPPFDHAVSAFLEDVHQRGLSDKILLVCCGEMGRTPRVDSNGGRNHWGNLSPLMLAGGGLNMGQVIGQSTRDGGQPATEPYGIPDLIGTIMHTLFDVGQLRLVRGVPREVAQIATANDPIPGLL